MGRDIGLFAEMRVWPLRYRNNRNTIYNLKKNYKKQIDKPHHIAATPGTQRNTPEHSFNSCSEVVPASHSGGTTRKPLPLKGCRFLARNLVPGCSASAFQGAGPAKPTGAGGYSLLNRACSGCSAERMGTPIFLLLRSTRRVRTMRIRYCANALPGSLNMPVQFVESSTAEQLAELAAAMHWRDHPEDSPTVITALHLADVDGRDLGLFEVRCEMQPIFKATLLQRA